MTFVIAANHRFRDHLVKCWKSISDLEYRVLTYDLGGLGAGIKHDVKDELFNQTGCYKTGFTKWRSRAMHVCSIMARTLTLVPQDELLVYMDADTRLLDKVDELDKVPVPFDVGITVRPESEWEVLGRANSGVVMLRNTLAGMTFLNRWMDATDKTGSIQVGLNTAAQYDECLIAEFPTAIYNNYHEPENPPPGTKIVHFRASMSDV